MRSLERIEAQLAKLQAEKDAILARERGAVIERVKEAIATYRITIRELNAPRQGDPEGKPVLRNTERSLKMRSRVKYKDPEGRTWSGYGKSPKWVREYLARNRKHKLTDLLVEQPG